MADTPPDQPNRRAPVHMGLRVLARHSAGRHGGRHLAHEVVEARTPKHLHASMRLAEGAALARSAHPAPPPPPPGWSPHAGVDPWPQAAGYDPWAATTAPSDPALARSP